jgi:hypothetical protein
MKTKTLFEQLETHTLVGASADYPRAREHHPALAAYKTPESVVGALRRRSRAEGCTKNGLVAALLVEANAGARSLQEVLLQGFLPRLTEIRGEGETVIEDIDTLEALLATAFAEAVATYPGPQLQPDATSHLVRTTIRLFMTSACEFHEAEAALVPVGLMVLQPDESPVWSDPPWATGAPIECGNGPRRYTDEAVEALERTICDLFPAERLAVVEASLVHDETRLDRRYSRLNRQLRSRKYGRLHAQLIGALAYLRRTLPTLGTAPKGGAS